MTNTDAPRLNPVLWLVFVLPAIAIVAGVGLVIVASRSGGSDAVSDAVRRTAQMQVSDLTPDRIAQRERLSAVVRIDAEHGTVEVLPASGRFRRDAPLQLTFAHPSRASADRRLRLEPSDTGWRTMAELDADHDWNLRLAPDDGSWRLQGRLAAGNRATRVSPALRDGP